MGWGKVGMGGVGGSRGWGGEEVGRERVKGSGVGRGGDGRGVGGEVGGWHGRGEVMSDSTQSRERVSPRFHLDDMVEQDGTPARVQSGEGFEATCKTQPGCVIEEAGTHLAIDQRRRHEQRQRTARWSRAQIPRDNTTT